MKGSNVLAFLGGALVGGVVALLTAPKSGRETRQQIMDFVEDEYGQVKDFVDKNVNKAKDAVNRGKEMMQDELAQVKNAVCDVAEDVVANGSRK